MTDIKSVSAVKPNRGSGQTRGRRAARRGNANVLWRRITASYDEEVRAFGANPALVSPITRWVLFQHLTSVQGMAGRRYADIVKDYQRFTMLAPPRTPRSANLEPEPPAEDNELIRRMFDGSLEEYEQESKHARRQYKRLMRVINRLGIASGAIAKNALDELCLFDREPPPQLRGDIAIVLNAIAKEFGIGEKRK